MVHFGHSFMYGSGCQPSQYQSLSLLISKIKKMNTLGLILEHFLKCRTVFSAVLFRVFLCNWVCKRLQTDKNHVKLANEHRSSKLRLNLPVQRGHTAAECRCVCALKVSAYFGLFWNGIFTDENHQSTGVCLLTDSTDGLGLWAKLESADMRSVQSQPSHDIVMGHRAELMHLH